MSDFKMPSLGADMDDGTLATWKVKPGDHVKRGDIIADVETAKGIIEIEVFEDGVIDALLIEAGKTVPVGEVIARICTEAELAVPGLWTAHIEMLVTDFDLVTLHREFTIQEPNQ